jgi:hypothetical protein
MHGRVVDKDAWEAPRAPSDLILQVAAAAGPVLV